MECPDPRAASPVERVRSHEDVDGLARDDMLGADQTLAKPPGMLADAHLVSVTPALLPCRVMRSMDGPETEGGVSRTDSAPTVGRVWRSVVPAPLRRRVGAVLASRRAARWRRPRNLGDLRTTTPFSTWGSSRGGPLDRVYIGWFLERHAGDIRGRALEIAGDEYIRAHGRDVVQTDILDVFEDNPRATIVGDIADAPHIADNTFDCVLVTQVLPFIYEPRDAFRTAHRILAPGGVLLVTTPGLCRIAPVEDEQFGHWWNFTGRSAQRLAEEVFGEGNVDMETFGNVLAACAFLYGLGPWDVSAEELAVHDPAFEVTIGIRAVKRD